ncbi:MAG TPA: recombinase RecT [Longimicrobiales bacterium]
MTQTESPTDRPDATVEEIAGLPAELGPIHSMPLAMRIWFDDRLFDRARIIAKYISEAQGFTPPHLVGKPQACFAVVVRALTWRLDPYAVAMATYQTPGGRVGFEGKLCQAIIENSGKLDGPLKFEYYGDWSRVLGKFKIVDGGKGRYPAPTWTDADAAGLGIKVTGHIKGELDPRELTLDLVQCHPRNSTLWATDPKTQIHYTAVRRFGSAAVPSLFMGVPFDWEDAPPIGPERAIDVTPRRPRRADFDPEAAGHEDPARQYRYVMSGRMPDTDDESGEADAEEAEADQPAAAEEAQPADDSAATEASADETAPEAEAQEAPQDGAAEARDARSEAPAEDTRDAGKANGAPAEAQETPSDAEIEASYQTLMAELQSRWGPDIEQWWVERKHRIAAIAARRPDLYSDLLANANSRKRKGRRK